MKHIGQGTTRSCARGRSFPGPGTAPCLTPSAAAAACPSARDNRLQLELPKAVETLGEPVSYHNSIQEKR